MKAFRVLTPAEISALTAQGCSAADWSLVRVMDGFDPTDVRRVHFGTHSSDHPYAEGLPVEVLDETGGYVVRIHSRLSYQEALAQLRKEASYDETAAERYEAGCVLVENGVRLSDIRLLAATHLYAGSSIVGASRVVNCSIHGHIGDGVILEDVVVLNTTHIDAAAQLDHCFVGQGCHIGRMYSATQSLFFANCHFENGEACAYLAGPYSVSHHKATLMIACMTSFFNAGSGSNQSNHSYKMGPNKFGVLARGSKLGSSSYLYWPARVGEFSTVIGHHFTHFDLTDLPFSLIAERDGQTHVIPGQNLASCGLRRDVEKWPKRDKRGASKLDSIDFSLFQPQTVAAIRRGLALLEQMHAEERTDYQGCVIARHQITKGIRLYQMALRVAEGDAEATAEWHALMDADAKRDIEAYEAQIL